ncbi:HAD family hydrolase, partial [Bacillus toyonensis]
FALASWGSKTIDAFKDADYILEEPKDILKLI